MICKRVGNIAYEVELPAQLVAVPTLFHMYMIMKCFGYPSLIVPTKSISIKDNMSYEETPAQILGPQVLKLRTKELTSVKLL